MLSITDPTPQPPCPAPFNMAAHVLGQARATPDKVALSVLGRDHTQTWTYADLEQAVRGTATGFLQRGLTPGARILLRLGNTVDFPIAYLAAIAAGMVPVPTASALTGPEVAKIIAELSPALILRDDAVACPDHPLIMTVDDLRSLRDLPQAGWHMGPPDRPGYIVYTSGTSGQSRAVVHAHRAIWARQMMFEGWYGMTAEDRLCHAGAFNWTYTMGTGLMDPWTLGATALIPEAGLAPTDLPGLLEEHRVSIFAAAPGVYRQMLKLPELPSLPHLRHGLSAGEKLPQSLRDAWRTATGTEIYEAFGMSECSTFLSASPASPASDGALGRPQIGRHVAILGADGPVPYNTAGTIAIHNSDPGLMLEYLGAEAETRARFVGDWFLTGDMGTMDPSGQITYLGRNDDMMNAGGFRVSPVEVEAALADFPGLTAVAATEIDVKKDVTVIAAFYTAAAPLEEAALAAHAAQRLARYKQPRQYIYMPALPMGANGKIMRRTLRQTYKAPRQ